LPLSAISGRLNLWWGCLTVAPEKPLQPEYWELSVLNQNTSSPDHIAAIDLGSNSFHMIIARQHEDGSISIVDKLREPVRLAAGLVGDGIITEEVYKKALECLERFGQRIRGWEPQSIRAVGTNALRRAANTSDFLLAAENALGHSIEIISGREEARLVYLGVVKTLDSNQDDRLVVDIGGSSTEIIRGEGIAPSQLESIQLGCVTATCRYFPDGKITAKAFRSAELMAISEVQSIRYAYKKANWNAVMGAAGTIKAADSAIRALGLSKKGITASALESLAETIIKAEHLEKLKLPSVNSDRISVFPGGIAVLSAIFKTFKIENMQVAEGGLREGVLFDLLGRIRHEDVRSNNVLTMANRYNVNLDRAENIYSTAGGLLKQLNETKALKKGQAWDILKWASQLIEAGLAIAHTQYHVHSTYIVENSDLFGFSRDEQKWLSILVRLHRKKINNDLLKEIPSTKRHFYRQLLFVLRLGVLLNRSHLDDGLPKFKFGMDDKEINFTCPGDWLNQQPLIKTDLEKEASYLKSIGYQLNLHTAE